MAGAQVGEPVVGQPDGRCAQLGVDAVPKVTGEFEYSSDLFAAGMLWGATTRSPHAASANRQRGPILRAILVRCVCATRRCVRFIPEPDLDGP